MKRYLLLLLFLTALQYSKAQPAQFKFDHFTVKDGLPSKNGLPDVSISFIQQDEQGYLWIGAGDGLVRFDGYTMRVYHLGDDKDKWVNNYTIYSMITDENKNLWFTAGTDLFKYNRATDNFTQYRYPKPKGAYVILPFLGLADNKGNLWETVVVINVMNFKDNRDELVKFDQKNKTYEFFGQKQKGSHYLNWTSDNGIFKSNTENHQIWVGTNNGLNLYNYKDDNFHPFGPVTDTARQKSVYRIYEAPSEPGILWFNVLDHFSKQYRIERFDTRNKTFKDYSHFTNRGLTAHNDTISYIYEDGRRRLWFGSSNGLMLFNRQTETFTCYIPADTDKKEHKNQINYIAEGKNGQLWLACGKGLLNFDPETHQFLRLRASVDKPDALGGDDLNSLLVDHSGALWVGLNGKGLDKLNSVTSAFATFIKKDNEANGYPVDGIQQIANAGDGNVWFATDKGIFKWKPGTDQFTKIYETKKEKANISKSTLTNVTVFFEKENSPYTIAAGKEGDLYFSKQNGLHIYNPVNHQQQSYFFDPHNNSSISSNAVSSILQDHSGAVWVGTDKGICKFNPVSHQINRYAFDKSDQRKDSNGKLIDKTVRTIYEDRQGTIWIGTNQGGQGELCRFDQRTGRFTKYPWNGNTRIDLINELYEDRKGRFWVGTGNEGLFEFDRKRGQYTKHINEDNGLLYKSVTGIREDNKGFLWLNSPVGLSRLDPAEMSLKTFPFNTILPGKEAIFNNGNLISINGQMVIGLSDGITTFDPLYLDNSYPPLVHIESLAYSDPASRSDSITTHLADNSNEIELPYNQNRITFNYVALHFTNPAQNRYAYTLDGYDKRWIQAGTLRSATYTNLTPGAYTFRVKACSSDGVWNNKGDSFTLIIDSPWWQRWWALLCYLILFALAVYAFVYYRSLKLLMDKRALEQTVQIRTEEVLHQKEEILSQRDNLEKTLNELKTTQNQLIQSEKMASLGELTAGIAHEIQNPLNFVNNFSEVNTELLQELKAESEKPKAERDEALEIELINDLIGNEQKINLHGKRADGIVKGMLEHSRSRSGQREPTDLNAMADECMRLSYRGLCAKDKAFNADLLTHFDPGLPKIEVVQQDMGRVMLNLFNNAFYAVNQKQKDAGHDYKPEVSVKTYTENGQVIIKVRDNGVGIPDRIKDKIMQPFFTTKPTGEGTGLGLSLTYDMVVKGHGGSIEVNTKEGDFTEFTVTLPL